MKLVIRLLIIIQDRIMIRLLMVIWNQIVIRDRTFDPGNEGHV